jgi:hypothetical protein
MRTVRTHADFEAEIAVLIRLIEPYLCGLLRRAGDIQGLDLVGG